MKKIRFIHTADLHLDSPFRGLSNLPESLFKRARESTFHALDRLIDYAILEDVDFIVMSGDLFDGENRSLRAQSKLKKSLEKLNDYQIPCYIIHGNHDHLNGSWISLSWPSNVFFFQEKVDFYTFIKNDIKVNIYGFSYPDRNVLENRAHEYERQGEADYHIGLLHGQAEGHTGHDPYAPFTVKQLLKTNFHYWALGHIHKRQILHENPHIVYPGNTQGRHRNELDEKGCYLVELTKTQTTLRFLQTSIIDWKEVTISIEDFNNLEDFMAICESKLEEYRKRDRGLFICLRFIGNGPIHQFLIEQGETLMETLNEGEENKNDFLWINHLLIETIPNWNRELLKNEAHIVADIIKTSDKLQKGNAPLDEIFKEVYDNPKIKRYISTFTDEEQKELLLEAETSILSQMLREMGE